MGRGTDRPGTSGHDEERGAAGHGMESQAQARDREWSGKAWQGMERQGTRTGLVRPVTAWRDSDRQGTWIGSARLGANGNGMGLGWPGNGTARQGLARDADRNGKAWLCGDWHGEDDYIKPKVKYTPGAASARPRHSLGRAVLCENEKNTCINSCFPINLKKIFAMTSQGRPPGSAERR